MWITDPFIVLLSLANFDAFSFYTCMFQAPRKKDTAIWTSVPELRHHLERKCDGMHTHAKWGRTSSGFATAEECAYNDSISAAWAEAIYQYALSRGFQDVPETVLTDTTAVNAVTNKAILGCLPRGRKILPFITDFLQPQVMTFLNRRKFAPWHWGNVFQHHVHCFLQGLDSLNFQMQRGVLILTTRDFLHLL